MSSLIDRILGRENRREFQYLLPSPLFRNALERERMRADRNQAILSLVEFQFEPAAASRATIVHVRRLERILAARLRGTDISGLLGDLQIGVLLPDTSALGARTLIADLTQLWGDCGVRLVAKVSVYSAVQNGEQPPWPDDSVERRSHSDRQGHRPHPDLAPAHAEALLFAQSLPVWKRAVDVLGAIVGLVMLAPLLAVIALMILLTSGRPVLFKQRRAGLGGRPFWMYKFRTMCRDAEAKQAALRQFSEQDGPAFKLRNDPRVTPLGRFLRKTCLDELPQLWHVLWGEMTLVGPRALDCRESDRCDGWQRRRLDVTPGLTCIFQVERTPDVPFVDWMRMDLRYIRTRTLWQDIKLLCRTAVAVVLYRASH